MRERESEREITVYFNARREEEEKSVTKYSESEKPVNAKAWNNNDGSNETDNAACV